MSTSGVPKLSRETRTAWTSIFLLSCIVNVLALAGAIYAMQVFDRVLTSRSLETLLALSLLAVGVCIALAAFDLLRSQLLLRIANHVSDRLMPGALVDMRRLSLEGRPPGEALQPPRDVDAVRACLAGPGPVAMLDLPWTIFFLGFVWLLHPHLGIAALVALGALLALAWVGNCAATRADAEAQAHLSARLGLIDAALRNSDATTAMGFAAAVDTRIGARTSDQLATLLRAGDVAATIGGTARALRLGLQVAATGLGAWLALAGELSTGSIIAASICAARVLSPVEQVIGSWRALAAARAGYRRLSSSCGPPGPEARHIALPSPKSSLVADRLTLSPRGSGAAVLRDVSLCVSAGEVLGVFGPSGAGKSSLLRGLAGVWPVTCGNVRLDGVPIERWVPAERRAWLGYMPQQVAFFPATIAENISRLQPVPDGTAVVAAARAAGLDKVIANLPDGYETRIAADGAPLSVGQRQQLALARAVFGKPFIVLLDEPDANLDAAAEAALSAVVVALRRRGAIVVIATHRRSSLALADRVAVLDGGRLKRVTIVSGEFSRSHQSRSRAAPSAGPDERELEVAP